MLHCKKCNGRVFIDRVFSQKTRIELFCIMCGKRWFINKNKSGFAKWLEQKENKLRKNMFISI